MIDIVFPNSNEKDFIEIAERLGIKGLVFIYKRKEDFVDVHRLGARIGLYTALISDYKNSDKAKKQAELVIVKSSGDDRKLLEKSKVDILYCLEEIAPKDFIHHRASGLNQVLCKLAEKNNILIGFSFSSLLNANGQRRAQLMGRIMQNILLCRKYKVKTAIASFATNPYEMRAERDLEALFTTLGMHPEECKDALKSVEQRLG